MLMKVIAMFVAMVFATSALAQSEYRLRPGDSIQVEVLEDSSLNRNVLILPDGNISVPLAGVVDVGGLTTTQVEAALASALGPNFATTPTVSVSVNQLGRPVATGGSSAQRTIFLMGEVQNPGAVEVRRGTTVLQALALTGGFTQFAATKRIQLRRTNSQTGEQSVVQIDFKAIEEGATGMGGTVLADGDVIIVPERRLFE